MDLYARLGLAPGATPADIKRAYRRMARRYHPGINPNDRAAAAIYRQMFEAYETLGDPARRRAYDAAGVPAPVSQAPEFEFSGFDFSSGVHGPQAATFTELFAEMLHPIDAGDTGRPEAGADLHADVTVSFGDAMRGFTSHVTVTRQSLCSPCRGTGAVRVAEGRCAQCLGSGTVRWARGHMIFTKGCPACRATGRKRTDRCDACGGQGRRVRQEAVAVRLPAGVRHGARLRVAERGHAGRHGARHGDLYVTVHVQPDPVFRREGDDLFVVAKVGVHEAVLGARVEVPSLEGPVRLRIPPGTHAGQRFRLRDRGAPRMSGGRGDLLIDVQIVLPAVADERAKDLMREFGKLYGNDERWNAEG